VANDFPQLYQPSNSKNLWAAFENGRVAAHSGFYPTEMKVEGLPLPVAGIGGVFSIPELQGQGIASTLVKKCADEAQKQGAALAFLWSDKHDFYAKLGFHLVGRQWTIALDPKQASILTVAGEKQGIKREKLRFSEEINGELLAKSYQRLGQYAVGIARTPAEHALLLNSGACRVISAWAGPDLAAYFVMGKGKDLHNYVHEWAGEEGALHQLAAHVLENVGQPIYVLSPQFMPDEVNWIYALDEMGIALRPEQMALVKLLDFTKVKKLVGDYMTRLGLQAADLKLEKSGEQYQVEWRKKTRLHFQEKDFLRFLFGPEMPTHQELKAFLPLRLWYWGMDSV
jgi:predicted N-acetyltransferase YhbS